MDNSSTLLPIGNYLGVVKVKGTESFAVSDSDGALKLYPVELNELLTLIASCPKTEEFMKEIKSSNASVQEVFNFIESEKLAFELSEDFSVLENLALKIKVSDTGIIQEGLNLYVTQQANAVALNPVSVNVALLSSDGLNIFDAIEKHCVETGEDFQKVHLTLLNDLVEMVSGGAAYFEEIK